VLKSLDESTTKVELLPVRPGLCRLSSIHFEDRLTGQMYRLDRPLEIFVRASPRDDPPPGEGEGPPPVPLTADRSVQDLDGGPES
jgi:hypothetical protein